MNIDNIFKLTSSFKSEKHIFFKIKDINLFMGFGQGNTYFTKYTNKLCKEAIYCNVDCDTQKREMVTCKSIDYDNFIKEYSHILQMIYYFK